MMPPSTFLPERWFGPSHRRTESIRLDTTGTGVMEDFPVNRVARNFISRYRARLSAGMDMQVLRT